MVLQCFAACRKKGCRKEQEVGTEQRDAGKRFGYLLIDFVPLWVSFLDTDVCPDILKLAYKIWCFDR
eukprot:674404-Rhodomonas_salina.1